MHPQLAGAVEWQGVERGPPGLQPAPGAGGVGSEWHEARRPIPLDKVALVAQEVGGQHLILDAQRLQQRQHSGVQRFARPAEWCSARSE
jgi:hypothetical protein